MILVHKTHRGNNNKKTTTTKAGQKAHKKKKEPQSKYLGRVPEESESV